MKIKFGHSFEEIVSVENILYAWREFVKGKKDKKDVQDFTFSLLNNILVLHRDLKSFKYNHGGYEAFNINDPKKLISKP